MVTLIKKNFDTVSTPNIALMEIQPLTHRLGGVPTTVAKKMLEATTQFYTKGDHVVDIVHQKKHHKRRLHKLGVRHIKGLVSTD